MNYKKHYRSPQRRTAALHRTIFFVWFTSIAILLCVLIVSSISSSVQSNAAQKDSYKYYTSIKIQENDTLWDIAAHYITSEYSSISEYVEEIKEINQLGDDVIHTGRYLTIPYFSEKMK